MVEAICLELERRKDFFGQTKELNSIYFGGGTPSVLSRAELEKIFHTIHTCWHVREGAEITLEANPDDLDQAYLKELSKTPVNRLSIGIQSFDEEVLQWMNRSHSAQQALRCIPMAQDAGFENLTMDLILGIPGQSASRLGQNIQRLIDFEVPHASVYTLTVEEKTALAHQVKKGMVKVQADEVYEERFKLAHQLLEDGGFLHYELSNYAKEGWQAQHNSSYWNGAPYLGVGPSAHSFNGHTRSWNIANNAQYLRKLSEKGKAVEDQEKLSPEDLYHEYLMTHLRKAEGISVSYIEAHFMQNWEQKFFQKLTEWLQSGHLIKEGDRIFCSLDGWIVSDQIISDFFL